MNQGYAVLLEIKWPKDVKIKSINCSYWSTCEAGLGAFYTENEMNEEEDYKLLEKNIKK